MLSVMKTKPISTLVDQLPDKGLTVTLLKALDFVVPGQWTNRTNFFDMVREVSEDDRQGRIEAIANYADQIYQEGERGAQRAMWLYQTVDSTDKLLAAAGMANRLGDKIGFLSFLEKLTPKPDTAQALDLGLKLAAEMLAFCFMRGISTESAGAFIASLSEVDNERAMRMAALVCLDGLIPLGPDFVTKVEEVLRGANSSTVEKNPVFNKIGSLLPGNSTTQRLGFVRDVFSGASGWMKNLQSSRNLTRDGLVGKLKGVAAFADDKLDYVGAFLDASTNYMEHTGTQTVARYVVGQACQRFVQS